MASVSFSFIAACWYVLMNLCAENRCSMLTCVAKNHCYQLGRLSLFWNITLMAGVGNLQPIGQAAYVYVWYGLHQNFCCPR